MSIPPWEPTYLLIVSTSLTCGAIAGYVMHRADFCVTAMFRDAFLFRDFFLLHMLVLLIVVSMVLFELGRMSGILSPYPFPLLDPPALTNVIGGFFFGVGMVLAGGCVIGTLYKMGAGSLASATAFVGLLAGSALYADVYPWWGRFAQATRLGPSAITLPQWLGLPPPDLTLPLALAGSLWLYRQYRAGKLTRTSNAAGHLAPWRAAVILAGVGFASYLFIGMPLGITTSYAKLGADVESLIWPGHVRALSYYSALPLNYIPPFSHWRIRGGPGPALDGIAAIQYPLIVGILLGALVSALLVKEFRLHYRIPARQYVSALLGGTLLGLSARMVPACNIWHLWGGIPILALQSLLFLVGLVPGTWAGSRLLARFVIR